MQNDITETWYDKRQNLGRIVCNGHTLAMARECIGYKADLLTPIMRYQVQAANDWNQSNRLTFQAASISALVRKLERHPHKLVKGD